MLLNLRNEVANVTKDNSEIEVAQMPNKTEFLVVGAKRTAHQSNSDRRLTLYERASSRHISEKIGANDGVKLRNVGACQRDVSVGLLSFAKHREDHKISGCEN